MFAFFKSFYLLPLAEVSYISFASIMIATILAIYLLNEKVSLRRWIAIFVVFIGILIILRPGSNIFNFSMLLPLLGATVLSVAIIVMKSVLKFDKPPTCSLYMDNFVVLIILGTLFFNFYHTIIQTIIFIILYGFYWRYSSNFSYECI